MHLSCLQVWSGSSGELVFNLCRQVHPVYCLAPSPDGECIATGSLGGNVSLWSLAQGHCLREVQGSGDTFDVSWSADGSLLCSCFSSGTLCVLDTTTVTTSTTVAAVSAPSSGGRSQSPSEESKALSPAATAAAPAAPAPVAAPIAEEVISSTSAEAKEGAQEVQGAVEEGVEEEQGESMEVVDAAEAVPVVQVVVDAAVGPAGDQAGNTAE